MQGMSQPSLLATAKPIDSKTIVPRAALTGVMRTDFWFSDGNIILIAGNAAFKVHRGQLSRHSEFFHSMFSLPQPASEALRVYDGCPWIELFDSPSDLYYFLLALYDGIYFKKRASNDFWSISAILRLSSKYFVDHLRECCLNRLALDWPNTLGGWDEREKLATGSEEKYSPRETYAHPIPVIYLALELGLDEIVVPALYDLCRYGPSKVACGTMVPPPALVPTNMSSSARPPPANLLLSRHLLIRTLQGRENAQRSVAAFIENELQNRKISVSCENALNDAGRTCRESYYFVMLNMLRAVGGIATGRDGDPLYTLDQAAEMLERTDFSDGETKCGLKMCKSCKADFAGSVQKARQQVWNDIPKWFDLGTL